MTRTQCARAIQDSLDRDIAELDLPSPLLADCWDEVAPAVADFAVALAVWERTGHQRAAERVTGAYSSVLAAWATAAARAGL